MSATQDSASPVDDSLRVPAAPATPASADPCAESPVFVLSASRSGSTLLRFMLDSHPALACPPETGIGSACTNLVQSLYTLENAASRGSKSQDSTLLSAEILSAARTTVGNAYNRYLRQRGKSRWCDKSLDSFLSAELFAQLWPQAKFICLYRHCMDVIASGVEACPWGISRFGFDAHVAQNPGNSVAAIGSYWLDCNKTIMDFQKKHPGKCHQIRYEDLVAAPESIADSMFSFIGVEPVPDIANRCFQVPHDTGGPGDEKIWFTTGVTTSSVGRGITVPARALPGPLRSALNELLRELSYRTIADDWNDCTDPIDPRADFVPSADRPTGNGVFSDGGEIARTLISRVQTQDPANLRRLVVQWPALAGETIVIAVTGDEQCEVRWTFGGEPDAPSADPGKAAATLMASPSVWRSLLDGKTNLIAEIISGNLRCVNNRDPYRLRSDEVHAIGVLLGLARIPSSCLTDDPLSMPA